MLNLINTTSYIFSKLGNNSSLLPMAVKDLAHSGGMTTSSYITGKEVEGKDRFIDEFGTQAIWLGGIPLYKKLIDLTLYKFAKYNPKIDIRILKDEKILKKAIEHAPTKEIEESIVKASKNISKIKGLALTKFIVSTVLTLGSYWGLTNFRHKQTEQNIIEEIKKEEQSKKVQLEKQKINENKISFGMNLNIVKDFMFDPVKNMMIVDGGITAERLGESRNPQDFMGYVVKEGAFWAFMYFAGDKLKKHFEQTAEKKHNKSIDLDIRVLQDSELKKALSEGTIQKSVNEMKSIIKMEKIETINRKGKKETIEKISNPEDLYEFLCTQKDNLVVKLAKKSEIIKTYKKTVDVDTQHYIDLDAVKGVGDNIEKIFTQYKNSDETIEKFLAKTIKLKRVSILKNIGISMGVLGLLVPGVMLAMRFVKKGNKEFQVKKQIHDKIKKEQGIIA